MNLRPDLWSWRRGLPKSGLRTSIRQDPLKNNLLSHNGTVLKINRSKCARGVPIKKTHPVWHPGGRFWAPRDSSCHNSDSEQQLLPTHHTNPISPLPNVIPDFQKGEKKEIIYQNSWFLAQIVYSQSMGLKSVLKIKAKTLKLFALQASPYKESKLRVNLINISLVQPCVHTAVDLVLFGVRNGSELVQL